MPPLTLTRSWLMAQGACAWYLPAGIEQFTEGQVIDRALVTKGRQNDVPVLWVGVRRASPAQRARLVAYTVMLRRPIVTALLGAAAPRSRAAAEALAVELLKRAVREGERRLRSAGSALRQFARDRAVDAEPTVYEADSAITSTLTATSYAGGSHRDAEDALIDWLSAELGLI